MDLDAEFLGGETQGVYHLRGGEIGFTHAMPRDDGAFDVRYESGWYCTYQKDGVCRVSGVLNRPDGTQEEVLGNQNRDIVKIELMSWPDACAKYPGIRPGFNP